MKINFAKKQAPAATTLLKFRHLLEKHEAGSAFFEAFISALEKPEEITSDAHPSSIKYRINRRVGSVQKVPDCFTNWEKQIERYKSSVRSKVDPPFLIAKRFFGMDRGPSRSRREAPCPVSVSRFPKGWLRQNSRDSGNYRKVNLEFV